MILRARFQRAEGKDDAALVLVKSAVAVDPRSAEGYALLGSLLMMRNQLDEAATAYGRVLELRPHAGLNMVELSRIKLAQKKMDEAAMLARQALKELPDSQPARVALVASLLARGNIAGAETESLPFAQINDVPEILVQRGLLQLAKKDNAKATASFQQAQKLAPDSLQVLEGLVAVKVSSGKGAEAEALIAAQLARRPDDVPLLLFAQLTYRALGNNAKAEQALKRIIEKDPANLNAYTSLALMYATSGRMDDAVKSFEAAVKARPDSVSSHTMLGVLLAARKDLPGARRQFENVLDLDPESAVAANNLAWMLADAGQDLDGALKWAQVAKRHLPEDPNVNDTLGLIYQKKGLATMAVPLLEASVAKEPKNSTYHYHLGLAQAAAGNKERAHASFERALALNAKFPEADDARRALAESAAKQ